VIGCLSSTLVLRTDLGGDPAFAELVDRVRATALDAYEHAAVPLEVHGAVTRGAAAGAGAEHRAPLVQLLFTMLPDPVPPLVAGPLTWRDDDHDSGLSPHDLALAVRDAGDRLELFLTYRRRLFSEAAALRLLDWLESALDTVALRPETTLSELGRPAADQVEATAGGEQPASDETIGVLSSIWRDLFERPAIGIDEDFFALGGHSLVALVMVERVEEAFGVELPLSEIFDRPTIRTLARSIAGLRRRARS